MNPLEIDPFASVPFGQKWLRNHSPWWTLVLIPVFVGAAFAASAIDGTTGSLSDFQLIDDLRRVFAPDTVGPSAPNFPLTRDAPSMFLMVVILLTCQIIWRQWYWFMKCFPIAQDAGLLGPRDPKEIAFKRFRFRLLRLDWFTRPQGTESRLEQLFLHVDRLFRGLGSGAGTAGLVIASAVLAYGVFQGAKRSDIFSVVAPPLQSHPGWSSQTYGTWWAGDSHFAGPLIYCAIAFFAIYLILLQNLIGLLMIYGLVGFQAVADLDYDFFAADDRGGWTPLLKAYRTVQYSLMVNGVALSFIVIVVGIDAKWVVGLIGLWVVVLPLYVLVPHRTFGRVARQAKVRRAEDIRSHALANPHDLPTLLFAPELIRRLMKERLNPLRVNIATVVTFTVAVLLPVALTAAQIFVPLRFGAARN